MGGADCCRAPPGQLYMLAQKQEPFAVWASQLLSDCAAVAVGCHGSWALPTGASCHEVLKLVNSRSVCPSAPPASYVRVLTSSSSACGLI